MELILIIIFAFNIRKHALMRQQKPWHWILMGVVAWGMGDLIGAWFLTMMFDIDWALQIDYMQKIAQNMTLSTQEQTIFDTQNIKLLPSVLFGIGFGLYIRNILLKIPPNNNHNNTQNNSNNNPTYFKF